MVKLFVWVQKHLEKLEDEHSCGCGADDKDGEKECTCNKKCEECEKSKDECTCDEEVSQESFVSEGFSSDTINWLRNKLIDLTHNIHGLELKGALYIDKIFGHPELKAAIAKQQALENSHDMKDMIQAHNMKLDLNELAGEDLINTLTSSLNANDIHTLHRALKNQLKQTAEEVKRK